MDATPFSYVPLIKSMMAGQTNELNEFSPSDR